MKPVRFYTIAEWIYNPLLGDLGQFHTSNSSEKHPISAVIMCARGQCTAYRDGSLSRQIGGDLHQLSARLLPPHAAYAHPDATTHIFGELGVSGNSGYIQMGGSNATYVTP